MEDEEASETFFAAGPGWEIWQGGVADQSESYDPAVPGTYRFKARWRKATEHPDDASNTPRTVRVTVKARAPEAGSRETTS